VDTIVVLAKKTHEGRTTVSTGILYHGLGIRGYKYVKTTYRSGAIYFRMRPNPGTICCPDCKSRYIVKKGCRERVFRTVPIGSKPVYLELAVQIIQCLVCGARKQVKLGFAEPKKTYTRAFERFVIELSKCMTITDISRFLGVCWDTVKDILKIYLRKKFSKPALKHLKWIAIDEVNVGGRGRFLTIVLDLKSGAVVFVAKGKNSKALKPFWKKLKRSRARVTAVAMDMSSAFISSVRKYLPKAEIVFDHFHVIKLMNAKITELRRSLYNKLKNEEQRKVLKGCRWILLKNPENLDESKNEKSKLDMALKLNEPLAKAYYMADLLKQVWAQKSRKEAMTMLRQWMFTALNSDIKPLQKMGETVINHFQGILAYHNHPISTGPLEAVNNNIGALQRQAYGYRDEEFFMLKIYALHTMRYAFVG
jgi:transposase